MKFPVTFCIFFCMLLPSLPAQNSIGYGNADRVARILPDSLTRHPGLMAAWIGSNLSRPADRIRAAYVWTTTNIAYDVASMYTTQATDNTGEVVSRTLRERKSVCQGYAELFSELCRQMGIANHVVHGITRFRGNLSQLPHAWVVAQVDSAWYFFDPTWGSGHIRNGIFFRQFSGEYFMVTPERNILTHYPYDPLWQCLEAPLSSSDFVNGEKPGANAPGGFVYADSIKKYLQMDKERQFKVTLRRMEQAGIINNPLEEYARYLRHGIEVFQANREIEQRNRVILKNRATTDIYNGAVDHYNRSVKRFNDYIIYFNHQFKPVRPEHEIRGMLDSCSFSLRQAVKLLSSIVSGEATMMYNRNELLGNIGVMEQKVATQQQFIDRYYDTPKAFRGNLFRKYSLGASQMN